MKKWKIDKPGFYDWNSIKLQRKTQVNAIISYQE